ncbi:MAG: hypothetical protein V3575_00940 [Candidatus Absconditabacteria bacterium]
MNDLTQLKEAFVFELREIQGKKIRKNNIGFKLLTLFFTEPAYFYDIYIHAQQTPACKELYEKLDCILQGIKSLDFEVKCVICGEKANYLLYQKKKFLGFSFLSCGKNQCNSRMVVNSKDCNKVSLEIDNLLSICPDPGVRYELLSFLKMGLGLNPKYSFKRFSSTIVEKLKEKNWG